MVVARCGRVRTGVHSKSQGGFSLVELLIVLLIVLIISAFAIPNIMLVAANVQLRSSAADLAGLMQQARIMAAKDNTTYTIGYSTSSGARFAFLDANNNGAWQSPEPLAQFGGTVNAAAGAPSGLTGQPPLYVPPGDTGTGTYTNSTTLGFSPRGFPCAYSAVTTPATCATPAATSFVYYLSNTRMRGTGWAAVAVSKSGRTKVVVWNGSAWK